MLLIGFAVLVVVVTLLPLSRFDAWWIRVFDFPRVQIFVLGVLVLAAGIATVPPTPATGGVFFALGLALAYQLYRIWPYTPAHPVEVVGAAPDAPPGVSLIVANVLMHNRRAEQLLHSIAERQPDLVLILEADPWWEQRLRELEPRYPHSVKQPQDNTYGMLLYSRLALIEPRVEFLVQSDVPSIHASVPLPAGETCRLHMLHPRPPSPTGADTTTRRDAELLIVGKQVKGRRTPTVVAGDLNDVAWSYTTTLFQKISGLLDPRKGRGMFSTYNAKIPLLRFPLDHVFHSPHFALVELVRLPAFGSDHFPIFVALTPQPGARHAQSAPAADAEDHRHARRKIAKARRDQASAD